MVCGLHKYPEQGELEFCHQFHPTQAFLAADGGQAPFTAKASYGAHLPRTSSASLFGQVAPKAWPGS